MAKTAEGNVTLAFIFVFAAGLCTTIGSTFAFCSNLASQSLLAGALGISAGVMIYVSFAEIFVIKAVEAFEEHGYDPDAAMRYSTFCFFAGVAFTALLDKIVHVLAMMSESGIGHSHGPMVSGGAFDCCDTANPHMHADTAPAATAPTTDREKDSPGDAESGPFGQIVDPNNRTEEEQKKADELQRMGVLTGLAIALHNFPEGLATFVATLADPSVGASIACAIALHNIPEGICVAMPIYYATGSKWKGFWWSFASGISEPFGGLMGYLVLYGDNMSYLAYGSLFGIVGGMMVYIAIVELIPTALKYDPEDKYVSGSVLIGMALMAASLLLFVI